MFKIKNMSDSIKNWVFKYYLTAGSFKVETFQERVHLINRNNPTGVENFKNKFFISSSILAVFTAVSMMVALTLESNLSFKILSSVLFLITVLFMIHRATLNAFSSLIFKTVNSFHSFKSPTWTLRDVDNIFSKKGWEQVRNNLTTKEFETFEVVIQSFDGPIEDLIIAVKEIEKE